MPDEAGRAVGLAPDGIDPGDPLLDDVGLELEDAIADLVPIAGQGLEQL